jgi:hypothetical protein
VTSEITGEVNSKWLQYSEFCTIHASRG